MGLKDLSLKSSYETLLDDPVSEFYVPVLGEAVAYDRLAGFFSSSSLTLAARGIAGLISKAGHMRMVMSPYMQASDIQMLRQATSDPESFLDDYLSDCLGNIDEMTDEIERDSVRAFGWMLSQGFLELRIAYVLDDNGEIDGTQLFHQKVGIVRDAEGNSVSFSGSLNETAAGWAFNAEEFKVFKSWDPGQSAFFDDDVNKFELFWNNLHDKVRCYEPSGALKEKLIRAGSGFSIERSALQRYASRRAEGDISLFPYQKQAFDKWKQSNYRMLFEMATGTGKTRTALACVNHLLNAGKPFVCVIATPQSTLSRQWGRELDALGIKFDSVIMADSSNCTTKQWASMVQEEVSRIAIGRQKSLAILTTHASVPKIELTATISSMPSSITACLVADEVHGIGTANRQAAFLERYDARIGLSATPDRWFDEQGSEAIRSFFGGCSFVFSINDAQNTINPLTGRPFLCPYEYRLIFVSLNDEEKEQYRNLSRRIARLSNATDPEVKKRLEQLMRNRAAIKKDAVNKMVAFKKLIPELIPRGLIVFTSPKRIDEVERMLTRCHIVAHRFTGKQGTTPSDQYNGLSERDYLIKLFKQGSYQALVAMKCLDEGIDIPEATTAVLLSSSTNPREYVQRVGRVIRQSRGKDLAYIYDFVVKPDWNSIADEDDMRLEQRLFKQELLRVEDMRKNAVNSTELLFEIQSELGEAYGY